MLECTRNISNYSAILQYNESCLIWRTKSKWVMNVGLSKNLLKSLLLPYSPFTDQIIYDLARIKNYFLVHVLI